MRSKTLWGLILGCEIHLIIAKSTRGVDSCNNAVEANHKLQGQLWHYARNPRQLFGWIHVGQLVWVMFRARKPLPHDLDLQEHCMMLVVEHITRVSIQGYSRDII